jgi:hypothetical protein
MPACQIVGADSRGKTVFVVLEKIRASWGVVEEPLATTARPLPELMSALDRWRNASSAAQLWHTEGASADGMRVRLRTAFLGVVKTFGRLFDVEVSNA